MDFTSSSLAILLGLGALVLWRLLLRYAVLSGGTGLSTPVARMEEPGVRAAVSTDPGISPHRFIHSTMTPFETLARRQGVNLTTRLGPDVPRALRGDFDGFEESLRHVVACAVDQSAEGNVHVQVDAAPAANHRIRLRVSVSDSGEGLPSAQLQRLFHSSPAWEAVANWARRTGGFVWAESKTGEGTIAGFTTVMENAATVADVRGAFHRLRVLVAEENPVLSKMAVKALERAGHQADVAANGLQALHKAMHSSYDAILLDLDRDEEIVARLREAESVDGRHTPVIGLTGPIEGEALIERLERL